MVDFWKHVHGEPGSPGVPPPRKITAGIAEHGHRHGLIAPQIPQKNKRMFVWLHIVFFFVVLIIPKWLI